jgi:ribosomal protein S18 acetylase RimI-like enzyme
MIRKIEPQDINSIVEFQMRMAMETENLKLDENIQGIRLYVDKTNIHAQKVYKSIGMIDEHYHMFEWMKIF